MRLRYEVIVIRNREKLIEFRPADLLTARQGCWPREKIFRSTQQLCGEFDEFVELMLGCQTEQM